MIPFPQELDLGRDATRMKGSEDALRQKATVEELLDRMYRATPGKPHWPLQLLADEVGMGKTFVALGLAYSILSAIRDGHMPADFTGCSDKILVIAPQNDALVDKWQREVKEFEQRCIDRFHVDDRRGVLGSTVVNRLDDLPKAFRGAAGIVITDMGVLSGSKKLQQYDLKRRVLIGALFRFWGKRFGLEDRARLLKGAPESWPRNAAELGQLTDDDAQRLPFASEAECLCWIRRLKDADDTASSQLDELLEACRELSQPYARDRSERFGKIETRLNQLYRRVCLAGIEKALPLVIVDEAHNWKNGPGAGSNGYEVFKQGIAPITRRLLMLTATPFQLRPKEVLNLVCAGEVIAPSNDAGETKVRRDEVHQLREVVIKPVLEKAENKSRSFSRAWSHMPASLLANLGDLWGSPGLCEARAKLEVLANADGVVHDGQVETLIAEAVSRIDDPRLRDMVREGLWLFTLNRDLSQELGALVIRHRRKSEHRCVKVGSEFQEPIERTSQRGDRHMLHAASGIDVSGDGELPHYLLMRAVSEMKQGIGRSSLGSALTGCYSTLLNSDESRRMEEKLEPGSAGHRYLALLRDMVGEDNDHRHPKVRALTDQVLAAWRRGEKFLVFCFRTHTAKRLQAILDRLVDEDLNARLAQIGMTEQRLRGLRSRLTKRDDSLVNLLLDRVLWSVCWAARSSGMPLPEVTADDLRLRDEEVVDLARLALRARVDLRASTPDRVFIHRTTEHLLAARMLREKGPCGQLFRQICTQIADESWVCRAYGIEERAPAPNVEADVEHVDLNERGGINEVYQLTADANEVDAQALAKDLLDRRRLLDVYADGPSFWFGTNPTAWLEAEPRSVATLKAMHGHLLNATRVGATLAWDERLAAMEALRSTIRASSLLVRILPATAEREEHGWAESMVEGLFRLQDGQLETLAERLAVFLEDFQGASGPTSDPAATRFALYDASQSRGKAVVLVQGGTDQATRKRAFVGFNSPLLPDILVCTSVGAEGIDLHRHCRHVVHYDLAWNPAVLEQRTGRVDRIGSKAFRDRQRGMHLEVPPFLEVGVPFLAGTYDERMFEELRTRAQTFEVLTGGDVSVDNLEGRDDIENPEGNEMAMTIPVLPTAMVEDLRVKLHVWESRG